ncbi:ExsB family protein (plasmid) [Candidatus Accumulibacter phosphatis clade IIA str. UW-1]|jgi:7-cyano-7-deazaguanine synthase|uniref:7-cyano-7-deazaguanine synthase n=2 Tax=Candidatus Accumulibacter TaxID=327159 RepID=C7RWC1_ACCRE|nr:7-cyano-7-deazaguanine synthase [Candidatus Accumulibacter phosphatis]NMQ30090.1 7-cyano-7-deazaguanine synthase [Candidatus Accumulibacter phosphatis]
MTAALLLSGGMDSISIAWWKHPDIAITIDYGQLPAAAEITASQAICRRLRIPHHVLQVDCHSLGSGDMAGLEPNALAPATDWWPYRNQLLITLAAMKAVTLEVRQLWLGTVASDASHRDGTPNFLSAMSALLAVQEGGLTVSAPAIGMSTVDLVRQSGVPLEILAWAHSCHKADVACGACRGCNKYFEVLRELGNELVRSG